MRIFRLGKLGTPVLAAVFFVGLMTATPVRAFDAATIVTYLTTFFTTVLMPFLEETLMGGMRDSTRATLRQQMATTVGVQEALGQHAGVVVAAEQRSTSAILTYKNKDTFGTFGQTRIDGDVVSIGATAVTGCRRTQAAQALVQSRREMRVMGDGYNQMAQRYERLTPSAAESEKNRFFAANPVDLSWIQKPEVSRGESDRAAKALVYMMRPMVIPTLPNNPSPAAMELTADVKRDDAQLDLLTNINLGYLVDRTKTGSNASFHATHDTLATNGMEKVSEIAGQGAKTEAGVLREIALAQKQMLVYQQRLLDAQQQANLIASLRQADEINKRQMETASRLRGIGNQNN